MARMMQAQDTFVATLPDGTEMRVAKGEVFPAGHAVVKLAKDGPLFKELDVGEDETPSPRAQAKHTGRSTRDG